MPLLNTKTLRACMEQKEKVMWSNTNTNCIFAMAEVVKTSTRLYSKFQNTSGVNGM